MSDPEGSIWLYVAALLEPSKARKDSSLRVGSATRAAGPPTVCDALGVQAYDAEVWHELFVATAGAAAALAGLVFVAVSINIARILALVGVPERGLQTVLLLLGTVVVSVFGLAPQSATALGIRPGCKRPQLPNAPDFSRLPKSPTGRVVVISRYL